MADVILKDKTGNDVIYNGVKRINLRTTNDGNQIFVAGETVSKTIEPDFSSGDMKVTIPDNEIVTDLTITKPSTLIPKNVAKDIDIAGILGTFEGAEPSEGTRYIKMWGKIVTGVSLSSYGGNQSFAQLTTLNELPEWANLTTIQRTYTLNSKIPIYILGLFALTNHSKPYNTTYETWASIVTNYCSSATARFVGSRCGKAMNPATGESQWFDSISGYNGVCVKNGNIYAASYNGYGSLVASVKYQLFLIKIDPTL